jgi:demethylmenaquinone methyltransferase/2-methoxy-6-polyprenyl-1,4-benzoquinol methylase
MTDPTRHEDRFAPEAVRELARMFDDVSPRYDLLNRLMTLGLDDGWRRAMWRAVPEEARAVLDLCTGSGTSLAGLRQPGRLLLGVDASLAMLERAAQAHRPAGWAPRFACADAFRLPFADGSLDAITVAFGVRNLRPQAKALAEMARVLAPGGTLVVLEATAPRPGPLAPLHRFHLAHLIPLLGRLSPDPSAYRYLAASILDFGPGTEFEGALAAAGFGLTLKRGFLLGAAGLWAAVRAGPGGEKPDASADIVRFARPAPPGRAISPGRATPVDLEHRAWTAVQLAVALALLVALVVGLRFFLKSSPALPLDRPGRIVSTALLIAGIVFAAARTLVLWRRLLAPPDRR